MKLPAAVVLSALIALFSALASPASAASRPYFANESARFQLPPGYHAADVAIEAGWIAVTAENYDAKVAALFVYRRASASSWVLDGKLFEIPYFDELGESPPVMVALQNSTVAMNWSSSNAPAVFKRSGSAWVQQTVTPSNSTLNGSEIKIDGARILVGAGKCGDAEVFEPDAAGTWRVTAHLNEGTNDCGESQTTLSMALSGDTALLWATEASQSKVWIGAWNRTAAGWQRFGQLPDSALEDMLPHISLRGSLAITNGLFPRGANHVYLRNGNGWNTLPTFRPLDAYRLDYRDEVLRQQRGWLAQLRRDADQPNSQEGAIVDVWRQGGDNRFSHVAQLEPQDRSSLRLVDIYDNRVVASPWPAAAGAFIYVFELPADPSTPAPVRDDFQGGGNAAWHSVAGPTPRASGGRFIQSSTAAQTMTLAGNTAWTNHAVEADLSATSTTNTQAYAGLVARAGSGKYYYAVLRKNGKVELGKVVSGTRTLLGSASYVPRTWNRLRLETRGQLLDVQVDGQQRLSASDASITSGESGFTTSYTALALDNFTTTPRSLKMYQTHFNDEYRPGQISADQLPWSVSGGDWQYLDDSSGAVRQQRATSGAARLITGVPTDEQTVETRVRIDGTFAADGNWVGVIARYQDDGNLYYLSLRGSHQLTIRKVVGSVATELAGQSYNAVAGQYYALRLEVVGSKLRGYVNGQLRLEAEDDSLAAGRSGIATNNTQASFAYFLAYQP